ncbi:PEP-CTERM sorting domain-containing protein [Methylotuvimicrobium sp. KM1]|uniref:PEP-CTERM sorting domain-containing protein n=1 Tax=Methylotuvimicrobium sp. KM1 TaxID=3377707 RepID=UPI00384EE1C6
MKLNTKAALLILASCQFNAQADMINITVDGDLSDWGIQQTEQASDWLPNAGVHYTIQDQTGGLGVRLGAGYGGQAYDAEALYAHLTDTHLFIALATGHNPETAQNPSANSFGAGDFALDFGLNGVYELGINVKPSWDTFGIAGGVYGVTEWAYGLWEDDTLTGYKKSDHPTSIIDGILLGQSVMAISGPKTGYGEWASDKHYFYEVALGLDLLRTAGWGGESFNVHWTQMCANDSIIVDPPSVPEPEVVSLLLLGLIGTAWARLRKNIQMQGLAFELV